MTSAGCALLATVAPFALKTIPAEKIAGRARRFEEMECLFWRSIFRRRAMPDLGVRTALKNMAAFLHAPWTKAILT